MKAPKDCITILNRRNKISSFNRQVTEANDLEVTKYTGPIDIKEKELSAEPPFPRYLFIVPPGKSRFMKCIFLKRYRGL